MRRQRNNEVMASLSRCRHWQRHGPRAFVEAFLPVATGQRPPPAEDPVITALRERPSPAQLTELAEAWAQAEPDAAGDNVAKLAWEAVSKAITDLRSTTWKAIRAERFSATPPELFHLLQQSVDGWETNNREYAARRAHRIRGGRAAGVQPPDEEADEASAEAEESAFAR